MFEKEIDALHRWSRKTRAIAMEHFRVDVEFETKADGTPVTEADRSIEALLRTAIDEEFSGDAIVGEEDGVIGAGPRRWIIDPIDGTQNFRRGIPLFATLVALEDEHGVAVGFIDAPVLNQTWWAIRDVGSFRDGAPIKVSTVNTLEEAHISTGEIKFFRKNGYYEGLDLLLEQVARHRSNGDFWGHMLVAQGSVDAMIDPEVSIWDVAAVQIVIEEAGGRFTSMSGDRRYDAGNAISSNGLLHEQILKAFA